MANRFWVGGNGTWDNSTTTNWSATSGGAGGASAPTAADNVTFNSASATGTYAVTLASAPACLNLSFANPPAAGLINFGGQGITVSVSGNLTLCSNLTANAADTFTLDSATTGKTITCGSCTLAATLQPNNATGSWILQDAGHYNSVNIAFGLFNINGKTVTFDQSITLSDTSSVLTFGAATTTHGSIIQLSNAGATVNFNSASVTFTGGGLINSGGGTINCGTSVLHMTASTTIAANGQALNSVIYTAATNVSITGASTYASLSITFDATATGSLTIDGITVTGTLTLSAGAAYRATLSANLQTITAAAVSLTNMDFFQVVAAGVAAPWTGTRIGDQGQNSGITFTTPSTKYWVNADGDWRDPTNHWATSSGGTAGVNNVPLPQDSAVFNSASSTIGYTVTNSSAGQLYLSGLTLGAPASGALTWSIGVAVNLAGSVAFSSTLIESGAWQLVIGAASGTYTITMNGFRPVLLNSINFGSNGVSSTATWTLQDNLDLTLTTAGLQVYNGTFNTNGKTLTLVALAPLTIGATGGLIADGSTITAEFSASSNVRLSMIGTTLFYDSNCFISGSPTTFDLATASFIGSGASGACAFSAFNYSIGKMKYTCAAGNPFTVSDSACTYGKIEIENCSAQININASSTSVVNGLSISGHNELTRAKLVSSVPGTPVQWTGTTGERTILHTDISDFQLSGGAIWWAENCRDLGNNSGLSFVPTRPTNYTNLLNGIMNPR